MRAPWVIEEMQTADLCDQRLNERLWEVVDQLGRHPTASIPAACGGYAETAAAYRLFDNEKVTFDNVLQPHIDSTRRRVGTQSVVVLVQDTTEVNLTRPERQVEGVGPLDGDSRRGLLLHLLHAFTREGTALGTLHAVPLIRSDDQPPLTSRTRAERQAQPIEEKESYRWVETLRVAQAEAALQPETQFICVADSEADIYEFLAEAGSTGSPVRWIVRACQDRALVDDSGENTGSLRQQLLTQPVLDTESISIRGRKIKVACDTRGRRQPRESREAQVEVRAARVTLRAPPRSDRELPSVSVNAVLVREIDPPAGEPAVEWLLLTDLPIDKLDQVREVIRTYCVRWMVEVFFRTLKSGCRVEQRRFEHVDRWLPCLAVYLIVTWRTLYVCRLGRTCPDVSCEVLFEPSEWESVYQVIHRKPPPSKPPSLLEMVRMVAQLGGYVNRKRKDPPGPQTVWLGLQRVHDIAWCWESFGPKSQAIGDKDV